MNTDADTDAASAALTAVAGRLDVHGEALSSRVSVIARQRDAMRWQSPAARACHARIEALLHVLLTTSARLTLIADELRVCSARLANAP